MTTCHICNQVVVFAEQKAIVFCSRPCFDTFERQARENMHSRVHPSRIHKPPFIYAVLPKDVKLSDVAFGGSAPIQNPKGSMLNP